MNEENLKKLKRIVAKQKELCDRFVKTYGESHNLTRQSFDILANFVRLLDRAERRYNA